MSNNDENNKTNSTKFLIGEDNNNLENILVSTLNNLKKSSNTKAVKFALSDDPQRVANYSYIYKDRTGLIHPSILKRIRDSEELIGGIIIPLKANQVSLFGRPRANRFDIGFTINIQPHIYEQYSKEEIEELKREVVPQLRDILLNCGKTTGIPSKDQMTFTQFLKAIVEDVYIYGWWAVEVRRDYAGNFHSFRPVDAGTIYHASPSSDNTKEAEAVRVRAREILTRIEGHRIPIEPFVYGKYTWVQVINETPYQVFTDEQLLVWSLNPSTDIYRSGYPVSIIERILDSITMHINLTTHNKLFFLNGRAARSMMVIKSDTIDEMDLNIIRQQMTNHINSANASWRMPVFGLTPKDDITVLPLDGGGRDMEFSYLADLNKRMILAAFQVSPDEIAALSYLSRGTNSQALSESNNEWKLLKSQQSGLRPLLNSIVDFLNLRLLPQINPEWAKLVFINFEGLDADTPEKEATLIAQASSLYYTYNDILDRVEKERVPIGGNIPLNAAYLAILEKYFTMGEILETFEPERYKGASQDPRYQFYMANPAWFQHQQFLLSQQQMLMQQQQQEPQQKQEGQQQKQESQKVQEGNQEEVGKSQEKSSDLDELDSAVAQMQEMLNKLTKSEKELPKNRKMLLVLHKKAKKKILDEFERKSKEMVDTILKIAETGKVPHQHSHKKKNNE